jgi:hypothetical protein
LTKPLDIEFVLSLFKVQKKIIKKVR